MKHISQSIGFFTDKFKLTGELDEEINAGNQFYGEDLSKWLCSALEGWDADYLDEDWGWLIFATSDKNENSFHEICVYGYPDNNQQNDYGEWAILIHTKYKQPFLKFFTVNKYGETDPEITKSVVSALEGIGITDIKQEKRDGFN